MKARFLHRIAIACILMLFISLLAACGSNSPTSAANTPTTATPTQPPTTATPTQPTTATPTATSNMGTGFTLFTGSGFKINYPTGWQTSQKSKTASGKTIYSFEYSDNITGFHVALHTNYLDTATPIADLTGADMNCNMNTTSLPKTVMVNGTSFFQSDFLCLLASTSYEVRLLTTSATSTQGQTTIVYGAYQQATASPPFAEADQKYFEPMLQSFRFV